PRAGRSEPTAGYDDAMLLRLLSALAVVTLFDPAGNVPVPPQEADVGSRLLQDAPVKSAIEKLKRNEPQLIEDQIRLCEIPAPPFKEGRRAEAFRQAFQSLGLKNVRIDRVGNVLG